MSCAFIVMTVLLGSSMAIAVVLQPTREEPAASANSHHRCQGESLQSIRKGLLRALNLQIEPRLLNSGLDHVREKWRTTFSDIAHRARDAADLPAPAVSSSPESPDGGNSTSLKCCSMASEIFMKDLGWNSWVILPVSVTIVNCALCNPEGNVQCPSSHSRVQDVDSQIQVPCCQPTSQEKVHVIYVDESGTIVISSMQLTSSCGCEHDNILQPRGE